MNQVLKISAAVAIALGLSAGLASADQPVKLSQGVLDIINQLPGTWRLDMAQSRDTDGLPYKTGFTVIMRTSYPITNYTYIGDATDGEKPVIFTYNAIADGKIRPNVGAGGEYSMDMLPDGIMDAKLWSPDGDLENKFCIPYASMRKIICLATVTTPAGKRTMFTNVLDKVSNSVK